MLFLLYHQSLRLACFSVVQVHFLKLTPRREPPLARRLLKPCMHSDVSTSVFLSAIPCLPSNSSLLNLNSALSMRRSTRKWLSTLYSSRIMISTGCASALHAVQLYLTRLLRNAGRD